MLKEYAIEIFDRQIRLAVEHNPRHANELVQNLPFMMAAHATRIGDLSNQLWLKHRTATEEHEMKISISEWAEYMTLPLTTKQELLSWALGVHHIDLRGAAHG